MTRFTIPRDIYHGEGSLEILKTLKGKRAFVVIGGGSMKRFGFLQKVEEYLKEAGMEVELFEGVENDPSVETVMKGAAAMRKFEPDWIIAMGGGSPMDAAKGMWIFYEHPDLTFEEATSKPLPALRQKAKMVAIPSTSGTGTEVTSFAIITDYSTGIKYPVADFNVTPDIAILDPTLAETMPLKLIAHTGMDALTHAFEAYVSPICTNFIAPLALKAIDMVHENLIKSYEGDKEAKKLMHEAQCLAGMSFSNASLGLVHSMAHKSGAVYHIPHGCANAIYLPYVLQYNRKSCEDRYAEIARMLKLEGNTDAELVDSLINMVNEFNDKLNIPHTMKDYGIAEEVFKDKVKFVAHNAVLDPCTNTNPREVDDSVVEKLFDCAYYGKKVTF